MAEQIHIGTSGWSYPHWRGTYYPQGLKSAEWLGYYTHDFSAVELNNSFYKLPRAEVLEAWRDATPEGFVFAVKASRYITHMKKLSDPEPSLELFLGRIAHLGPRLGPILFQLPPFWRFNAERFEAFLAALPHYHRYVFEFRNPTWYDERAYALLKAHRMGFCLYDLAGHQSPTVVTSDLVYVRLHGPGAAYQGSYDDATLDGWAEAALNWAREGRTVHLYFDNDQAGYAAFDALRLQARVTQARVP